MGALTLPCSSIDDLQQQSAALQQWFSSGGRKIDGLVVRKCPSWLEPDRFIKAGSADAQFDTAYFRLMMGNKRDIWRVSIEMVFHAKARLLEDGSTAGPGILFNVLDDEGQSVLIDYFEVGTSASAESMTPEQRCSYWFKKLVKSHQINRIFAYKEFEAEID